MSAGAMVWPEPGRRLSPVSLTASILGHLALAGLLIAFGRFAAARMDQPKMYFVNLVPSLGEAAPPPVAPEASVEAPAPPAPLEKAAQESPSLPPPSLPQRSSPTLPPALPPRLPRAGEKESPSLASSRLAQRPVAAVPPPPPHPSPASTSSPASPAPSTATGFPAATSRASVTLDVADFPFTYYLQQLQKKVSERWIPPAGAAASRRSVVLFEISRDGRIGTPAVEQSSGNALWDQAALRAVLEASPFPPLPQEFPAASLRVHFGFEISAPLTQGPGRP